MLQVLNYYFKNTFWSSSERYFQRSYNLSFNLKSKEISGLRLGDQICDQWAAN